MSRVILADSSVARSWPTFARIASMVKLLRDAGKDLRLVVPAIAHTEIVFALRRKKGAGFDAQQVIGPLQQRGVVIEALDREAAEKVATVLSLWFPSDDAWKAAKTNGNLDWHIAAHAESLENSTLLVHDRGPEFARVSNPITADALISQLQDELASLMS